MPAKPAAAPTQSANSSMSVQPTEQSDPSAEAWGYDCAVISEDGNAPCCMTMCSQKEFERRTQMGRQDDGGQFQGSNHSISTMERDEEGKARLELAVCRYEFHRGGAGNVFEAKEIRTLDMMHHTIDHCQNNWLTPAMIEKCAPSGYVYVYKAMHDVIKAISSDMAYLRRHYPPSLVVAGVFERCVRIAIDAHYRIAEDLSVENARNLPWSSKWLETHGIINHTIGMTLRESIGFTRCAGGEGTSIGSHEDYIYKNLMTLVKDVYPDLRAKNIRPTFEPEFAMYGLVLLSIRQTYHTAIQDMYYSLPPATRRSGEVKLAMELAMCIESGNYVRFFAILRRPDTPYLVCCLAHQHRHAIRQKALYTMIKSREKRIEKPVSVGELVQHMGFHDEQHCLDYLKLRGIPVSDGNVLLFKVTDMKAITEFEFVDCLKVGFITAKMPASPATVIGPRPGPRPGEVAPPCTRVSRQQADAAAAALRHQALQAQQEANRLAAQKAAAAAAAKVEPALLCYIPSHAFAQVVL
jgi:hypothetical protein